jgi:hypothetical protein
MRAITKVTGLVAVLMLLGTGCLSAAVLSFTDVNIAGTSNLFSASGGALAGGTAAVQISFGAEAGQLLQFSSVTGSVGYCNMVGCTTNGADGGPVPAEWTGTNISATNDGLSGITFIGQQMFLIGVFLDPSFNNTGDPANLPAYNASSVLGSSFSPGIGQVFFIGDGQGTSGTQTFFVPSTATSLFLGFADGTPMFGSLANAAAPAAYNDNQGNLVANFTIATVPEPGTLMLLGIGLSGLAFLRRKRS